MLPYDISIGPLRWTLTGEADRDALYRASAPEVRLIAIHRDAYLCDSDGLWADGRKHTGRWLEHDISGLAKVHLISRRPSDGAETNIPEFDPRVRFRRGFLPAGTNVDANWLDGGLLISQMEDLPTLAKVLPELSKEERIHLAHRLSKTAMEMLKGRLWHGAIDSQHILIDQSKLFRSSPHFTIVRPTACSHWSERAQLPEERDIQGWFDLIVGLQLGDAQHKITPSERGRRFRQALETADVYLERALQRAAGDIHSHEIQCQTIEYMASTPPFEPIVQILEVQNSPVEPSEEQTHAEPSEEKTHADGEEPSTVPSQQVGATAPDEKPKQSRQTSTKTKLVLAASAVAVICLAGVMYHFSKVTDAPDPSLELFIEQWAHHYENANKNFDQHLSDYSGDALRERSKNSVRTMTTKYVKNTKVGYEIKSSECLTSMKCEIVLITSISIDPVSGSLCSDSEKQRADEKNLDYCKHRIYKSKRKFTLVRSSPEAPWTIELDEKQNEPVTYGAPNE
jgi:hypothetical protein